MIINILPFINLIGRHLVALTKPDDGMRFFREHALKSVWRPIIAFRNDTDNERLDYKTVNFLSIYIISNICLIYPSGHY
jgi:hypothetical protein